MKLEETGPGVYYATGALPVFGPGEIAFLRDRLEIAPTGRVRICVHRDEDDPFQEMFIMAGGQTYIRPHKHLNKVESLHVIQGTADAVFFDDHGRITQVVEMGDAGSGRTFFIRIASSRFHALVFKSDIFIFHEATQGPFRPEETIQAPWAPPESESIRAAEFLDRVRQSAALLVR